LGDDFIVLLDHYEASKAHQYGNGESDGLSLVVGRLAHLFP
jgi:hypothetical protein